MNMNKLLWGILIVLLIFSVSPWAKDGVPQTDDLRHHLTKYWWMHDQLTNHFTISEWEPHIYSGWPLTQFYHSLPYFIMLPFYFLTTDVGVLKLSMALAMFLGPLAMFWGAKKLTKNDQTALLAAIFYALTPMHFEFAYFSGSISRQWAFVFLPLAMSYFMLAVDDENRKTTILASLFFAALMWTHLNLAYAAAVVMGLYVLYVLAVKRDYYKLKHPAWFAIGTLLLLSFWLGPLLLESAESTTGAKTPSLLGQAPGAVPLSDILSRNFGIGASGVHYFYLGWSIIVLALATLLIKSFPRKNAYLLMCFAGLLLTFFPLPLKLAPYMMINYGWYLTFAALVPICILAAYGAKALTKLSGQPLIIFIILAVVLIDLYPAMTTYHWTNQPSENFVNPPELIQVWEEIGSQPGDFRVYSAVGQTPFRYHHKFEVGTEWMGFREGALQPIRGITDYIQRNLNNPTSQQAIAYFGTKFIVAPCPADVGRPFCAFPTPGADLISNISSITRTTEDIFERGINNSEAILVEECAQNCTTHTSEASVSNIDWQPETISFTAATQAAAPVLVRSAYFSKRWFAYIDGQPMEIQQAWPKYMLLTIPEGTHHIELRYETNMTHVIAWAITLLTLLAMIYIYRK